jgi:hypothetical protein
VLPTPTPTPTIVPTLTPEPTGTVTSTAPADVVVNVPAATLTWLAPIVIVSLLALTFIVASFGG